MIDHETGFRILAVAVAVALVAVPFLAKTVKWGIPTLPQAKRDPIEDAHAILEIASRLREAGNLKGVELCQQIIDAILKPEVKK